MLSTRELSAMQENAQQAAAVLRALSNETRLLVMCQLGQGEMSVGALQEAVSRGRRFLGMYLN